MTADQILSRHASDLGQRQSADKVSLFHWIGIADNGIGYVYESGIDLEHNEEEIAELKSQGFRYNTRLKMYVCEHQAKFVETCPIDFNKYLVWGKDSRYHLVDDVRFQIEQEMMRFRAADNAVGFLAEVGKGVAIKAKLTGSRIVPSDSDFGDFDLLYFKDSEGHNVAWLQRNYTADTIRLLCKRQKTEWVDIVGKVKRHTRRAGHAVTDLTRCELSVNGVMLHAFAEHLRNQKSKNSKEN